MSVIIDGTDGITTPELDSSGPVAGTTGTFSGAVQASGIATNLYPLVSGTSVASTSGTSIDFTGIPSWVKRITVMINGLSYAAAGQGTLQIGSGSLTTSGYTSNTVIFSSTGVSTSAQTNGFGNINTSAAATTINGIYILTLVTGNTWSFMEQHFRTTDNSGLTGNGFISLSGALDRLSLVATTSTFDAGTINILYE